MGALQDENARDVAESLELRVSVYHRGEETDVLVRAMSSDRIGRLAEKLGAKTVGGASLGVWCARRGNLVDPSTTLGAAGVRWGDRLILGRGIGEPTKLGGAAIMEVIICGGPCTGERFELGEGVYTLGREASADIVVDDPSISRHHLDVTVDAAGVSVVDVGSSNGTALGGKALRQGETTLLGEQHELELGRTLLRARPISVTDALGVPERSGHLDFNRPPRVSRVHEPYEIELEPPPAKPRKSRLPLAASMVPLFAGVLLFVLLKSPAMLALAGMSPLMAISTFVSDRRGGRKSFSRETSEFRARVTQAHDELVAAIDRETIARRIESPDAPTLMERVGMMAPSLWERRTGDEDFLRLRLGVGDQPAMSRVTIKDGGDTTVRAEATAELSVLDSVPSVPVVVDVRAAGVVGLSGDRELADGLARWLVLQAAILHSPGELVVMAALSHECSSDWGWLKWLPHLRPDRVGFESAPISTGRPSAEGLFLEIRDLAARRRAETKTRTSLGTASPHLLLVCDEDVGIDRSLVSAALSDLAEVGISAVWIGREARDLPGQTGSIVEISSDRAVLSLTEVATGARSADVSAEAVSVALADRTARLLAPVRDVSEQARAGDIPRQVGLLDLLGLLPPTAEALKQRWSAWNGNLRATIGVGADGPLTVDLRNEGPHALIAGTTGSGKSELLRTLVAAAAAAIPPDKLSFLLVDYKGGAAFAPCAALPHVVDIVSDLDEHLAERALVSLNAELKRREVILARHNAKDLLELTTREPSLAPPLLVIAVDEFAKLRDEVPEFVDGVVDIAQRGRSLGVHMILAAQSLRTAFTPAIRANTNMRLALRVAEESESEDVIASPAAARIPSGASSRGRAFARTGHGELREFQSAYVSGLTDRSEQSEMSIEPFDSRTLSTSRERAEASPDSDTESDLVNLGDAARQAQEELGLPIPAPPWLPVLPDLLDLGQLSRSGEGEAEISIGLVDLPHRQRQDPLTLELRAAGHVGVFGGGNSGKTTLLTTAALALAEAFNPTELHLYAIDAASGGLSPLKDLAHCGGVVGLDDEERIQRLMRMLVRKVQQRATLRDRDHGAMTVLLIDGFGSFAQQYDRPGASQVFEQMRQILAAGRAAQVHVILTASRRGEIPAALSTHIGQRLFLRMPTEDDMLAFGVDTKVVRGAKLARGSGFTEESHEFHVAIPMSGDAAVPLADAVAAAPADYKTFDPDRLVSKVDVLPAEVPRSTLIAARSLDSLPIGVSDEHLGPASVDLSELHFLVVGPYRSGRSTALATLAAAARMTEERPVLHLFAPRRSRLRDEDGWESVATSTDECADMARALVEHVEAGDANGAPVLLFIDDAGELNDPASSTRLERLVRISRDSQLRLVVSVDVGTARGIAVPWIRELRREGHGLLLQPDLSGDGEILGAQLPRRASTAMMPGRGFLVSRGAAELIHVAN